jgi:hypothetical protein
MTTVNQPPVVQPLIIGGTLAPVWNVFFSQIFQALNGPFQLASYTVAKVPAAKGNEGALIYVSNESGGKTVAFSDGAHWLRVQDRAVIS